MQTTFAADVDAELIDRALAPAVLGSMWLDIPRPERPALTGDTDADDRQERARPGEGARAVQFQMRATSRHQTSTHQVWVLVALRSAEAVGRTVGAARAANHDGRR